MINLKNTAAADSTVKSGTTQTVKGGDNDLVFEQSGDLTGAIQAGNRIVAGTIGEGTAADVVQDIQLQASSTAVTLNQQASGASNVQVLNDAESSKINGLEQKVTTVGGTTAVMNQGTTVTTGATSTQAINRIKSADIDIMKQDVSNTNLTIDMNQGTGAFTVGTGSVQAVNLIDGADSIATGQEQVVGAVADVDMDQVGSGKGIQALNAVISASGIAGSEITQKISQPNAFSMVQTGVSNGLQAGNYLGERLQ